FWNHVPLAEAALPTKYGPKFRLLMTRSAALGPVAPGVTSGVYQPGWLGVADRVLERSPVREVALERLDRLADDLEVPEVVREIVEDRLEAARVAALAVEADREPVRLVADPLQQLQARVVRVEPDRIRPAGDEHLLDPLRERDHGDTR